MAKKKVDKLQTGAVWVRFTKDLPYLGRDGKPIEKIKKPLFKSGQKVRLKFTQAGKFTAAGYCKILNKKGDAVVTSVASKEA